MGKSSVVFELTDDEVRVFWFSESTHWGSRRDNSFLTTFEFDRIPIAAGCIEHGNVRNEKAFIDILTAYRSNQPPYRQKAKAYLAIPLQLGFLRQYTLPWIPKIDRTSAFSLLVDEEVPIPSSDLLYDVFLISEEKYRELHIVIGATRQSLLERVAYLFKQAGFNLWGINFSLFVLGQGYGFQRDENTLYLHAAVDQLQMILFRGTLPESIRSLPSIVMHDKRAENVEGLVDEWENEIRRFLFLYSTQHSEFHLKRIVWSGGNTIEALTKRLGDLALSIEYVQMKGVPKSWQAVLEAENKGVREVAIGYGIQISTQRPILNLWRQKLTAAQKQRGYQRLAILALALFMIGNGIGFSFYHQERELQKEVHGLARQGAVIEAQIKQQKEIEKAWKRVQMHPLSAGVGLSQLQNIAEDGLSIEQIIYKQGNLSIHGSTGDGRRVQTLVGTLRANGWGQPALTSYQLTEQNDVEFSVNAKRLTANEGG